jgi:hypothetical protein
MGQQLVHLGIGCFLLFFGGGIALYFAWRAHTAHQTSWAGFAHRHGMLADGFMLEGSYKGSPLTVTIAMRKRWDIRVSVVVLRISVRDALAPGFSLERRGSWDKLFRRSGQEDTRLGDAELDKHLVLKNLSPHTAAVLRQPGVQQHLHELVHHYRDFHIRDGWLQAERRPVPTTADGLEDFIGPAHRLVHTLEEAARRSHRPTTG